ncbi:MAG: protein kinase [Candidatus Nanopelagicaceae bacterium]
MDIEAALQILIDFIVQETQETLNEQEQAIIVGCLAGLTYKEINQQSAILRGLTVEFIARCLAYKLWKKLNQAINQSTKVNKKIKVRKNQIWYVVEEIINLQITNQRPVIESLPASLLEDKILKGRYEITEHLFDRNSIERHYLAIDRDLGDRPCLVVKLLPKSLSIHKRFEREAGILSTLGNHRQIPQLLAYFTEEQYYYLVYEYIEGEPLTNRFMEDQPWKEEEVIFFLQDILSVLQFIHQHGLVHRNLNPDNLIQQPDGKVVPVDFAAVKQIEDSNSSNSFARGMKGYLPAEQLRGIITPANDIYAIGNIAIHALTGVHPCQLKIDRSTGNPLWRDRVEVNLKLADLIDGMVCYYFPQRYQTATEVLTILKDLL